MFCLFSGFSARVWFSLLLIEIWLRIVKVAVVLVVLLKLSYSYQNVASLSGTELRAGLLLVFHLWLTLTEAVIERMERIPLSVCLSVCLLFLSLCLCLSMSLSVSLSLSLSTLSLFLSLSLWNVLELGTRFKVYGGFNAFHHLRNMFRLGTCSRDPFNCSSLWNNYIF